MWDTKTCGWFLSSFISNPSSGWLRMGRTEEGSFKSDERLRSFLYSCESSIKFLCILISLGVLQSIKGKAMYVGTERDEGTASVHILTPMWRLFWRHGGSAGLFTTQILF